LILFRYNQYFGPNAGNLNGIVTYGNFRISSYDGETLKLLDATNNEVAFKVRISENEMVIEELNAIKWVVVNWHPDYPPRDYRPWNGTYRRQI